MEDKKLEEIGIQYKKYRRDISNKPLLNATIDQYWNDIKFVLRIFNINIETMFSDKISFDKYIKKFKEYVDNNGLKKGTLSSYKSDCENFYNFWQKYIRTEKPNITDKKSPNKEKIENSYEELITSYLKENGKSTVDELFKYVSSVKKTGKSGKRYLIEMVSARYHGSEIFEYKNPYVWLKDEFSELDSSNIFPDEVFAEHYPEGAVKKILVNKYERNTKAKKDCINFYGTQCMVCGFKFSDKYGSEFKNKIHVHHIKPISEIGKEYQIDPTKDLIPVCPNCHLVLHSKGKNEVYTIDEVREMIKSVTNSN